MRINLDWTEENITDEDIARFWSLVRKTESCWIWTGPKTCGYGIFYLNQKCEKVRAHRFSFLLSRGYLTHSNKLIVLHKCPEKHRKDCVNPNHLKEGDCAENNFDAIKMGKKILRGSEVGFSILTEQDVEDMRNIYRNFKISYPKLGKCFGVGKATVKNIMNRKSWKPVP